MLNSDAERRCDQLTRETFDSLSRLGSVQSINKPIIVSMLDRVVCKCSQTSVPNNYGYSCSERVYRVDRAYLNYETMSSAFR